MKKIYCFIIILFTFSGNAQNNKSVYSNYNNTNKTVIVVEEKKQSLSDVIFQQEYLSILNRQANQGHVYDSSVKSSKKESKEILADVKINSSKILSFLEELESTKEVTDATKVIILDKKNGFKEIKFGEDKANFNNLISINNDTYVYKPDDIGLYSVFSIKSMDEIYLQFGNGNKLDNICLLKNYTIYKSPGVLDIALYDFRSVLDNYRSVLGKEHFSKIDKNKAEGMYIWDSPNIRVIITGGIDQTNKIISDLGNSFLPYFTTKVFYYKKHDIITGI